MPSPISPDPENVSKSSLPDEAIASLAPSTDAEPAPASAPATPAAPASDRWDRVRRFAATAGRTALGAAGVGFGCLAYAYLTLPDVRPLRTTNPQTTAFMELRADDARSRGEAPRRVQRWVRYRDISSDLKRAVLVAEDVAFWQHEGVDFEQLQESLEIDWAHGRLLRGGSTITQQLAKNLYLSPSKNPLRKVEELVIARRLEGELKKARIF